MLVTGERLFGQTNRVSSSFPRRGCRRPCGFSLRKSFVDLEGRFDPHDDGCLGVFLNAVTLGTVVRIRRDFPPPARILRQSAATVHLAKCRSWPFLGARHSASVDIARRAISNEMLSDARQRPFTCLRERTSDPVLFLGKLSHFRSAERAAIQPDV